MFNVHRHGYSLIQEMMALDWYRAKTLPGQDLSMTDGLRYYLPAHIKRLSNLKHLRICMNIDDERRDSLIPSPIDRSVARRTLLFPNPADFGLFHDSIDESILAVINLLYSLRKTNTKLDSLSLITSPMGLSNESCCRFMKDDRFTTRPEDTIEMWQDVSADLKHLDIESFWSHDLTDFEAHCCEHLKSVSRGFAYRLVALGDKFQVDCIRQDSADRGC